MRGDAFTVDDGSIDFDDVTELVLAYLDALPSGTRDHHLADIGTERLLLALPGDGTSRPVAK